MALSADGSSAIECSDWPPWDGFMRSILAYKLAALSRVRIHLTDGTPDIVLRSSPQMDCPMSNVHPVSYIYNASACIRVVHTVFQCHSVI